MKAKSINDLVAQRNAKRQSNTMLEKDIENDVCRYARQLGVYVRKFSSPGYRAVPDRMFLYKGSTWFIEFKAPGKKPTPAQLSEHQKIQECGGTVFVCDNIEQGRFIVNSYVVSNNDDTGRV
jgi:hypothetical protein